MPVDLELAPKHKRLAGEVEVIEGSALELPNADQSVD
jgi:hypothetical protein